MFVDVARFVEIPGRAYLAPFPVFAIHTLREIPIFQRPQDIEFLSIPDFRKGMRRGISEHDPVASVAGIIFPLRIDVDPRTAYVAHLVFR